MLQTTQNNLMAASEHDTSFGVIPFAALVIPLDIKNQLQDRLKDVLDVNFYSQKNDNEMRDIVDPASHKRLDSQDNPWFGQEIACCYVEYSDGRYDVWTVPPYENNNCWLGWFGWHLEEYGEVEQTDEE